MTRARPVVWFHRARAVCWLAVGVWSFTAGTADSVVLVWIASLYANVATDWGAGEAADDHRLIDELTAIRHQLDQLTEEARRGE